MEDLVRGAERAFGHQVFLRPVENGMADITYADLARFVRGLSAMLDRRGVEPGETVATELHNSTVAALLFIGVVASRRLLVPVNPKLGSIERESVYRRTAPRLVVDRAASTAPGCEDAEHIRLIDDAAFVADVLAADPGPKTWPERPGAPDAPAEVVFTSGSTGEPKGIVLSHRALLSNSQALGEAYEIQPGDTFVTVCPLFHNSGQVFTTLTPMWHGCLTTVVRSEVAMLRFWETVSQHQCHWTLVVNAYLALLVSQPQSADWVPGHRLRALLSGGSRLDASLIARFEERFGVPVRQVYGLTETTSVATCEPLHFDRRSPGSAGQPLTNCRVRIVPDTAGPESPGRIEISGENLFSEYLLNPELTAVRLRDGWLHTGDLGYLDEAGHLFIVEREDNMVIIGGENVYPAEVDVVASRSRSLAEATTVAVDDPVMGTRLVLVYRPDPDSWVGEDQLRSELREQLATFKLPQVLLEVGRLGFERIPRAENGKILGGEVQAAVERRLGEDASRESSAPGGVRDVV